MFVFIPSKCKRLLVCKRAFRFASFRIFLRISLCIAGLGHSLSQQINFPFGLSLDPFSQLYLFYGISVHSLCAHVKDTVAFRLAPKTFEFSLLSKLDG